MNWLRNFDLYIQGLIIASFIVVTIFIFQLFIFIAKLKVNKKVVNYIYAFSSGFLLITAIVGQLVSARSQMTTHWQIENISHKIDALPNSTQTLVTILVISIGFILGLAVSFISKVISVKYFEKEKHSHSHKVSHSHALGTNWEHLEHKPKSVAGTFIMGTQIIAHRIPAGIAMGMLINLSTEIDTNGILAQPFAFSNLIAFIFHLFPESLLLYLSLVRTGKKRFKAFLISTLFILIFVPLIFLGIFIGKATYGQNNSFFTLQPFVFAFTGAVLLWIIISELIPIFIHVKNETKQIYVMTITFMAGILLSFLIQLVHFH